MSLGKPSAVDEETGDVEATIAAWRNRLTPTDAHRAALQAAVDALHAAADKVAKQFATAHKPTFEPMLVGSAAKDTWVPGQVDLDMFLLFDPNVSRAELEAAGLEAGQALLPEWTLRYAEHPYVHGTWQGFDADVVPAYAVLDAAEIQSAVDRTPFHNRWVKAALRGAPALAGDIRVLKAWLSGIGAYGAETALGAVSGYLAEVLVIHYRGMRGVLEAFATAQPGHRVDATGGSPAQFPDATMVVIDPVDPGRNAASAVQADRFELICRASRAFLSAPSDAFFEPAPLPQLTLADATRLIGPRGVGALLLPLPTMREDSRVPHLRRGAQAFATRLARDGFQDVWTEAGEHDDGLRAWMLVVTEDALLPETRRHLGPPVQVGKRAQGFIDKYRNHADVLSGPSEIEVDGTTHWVVELRNPTRPLAARMQEWIDAGVSLGKHVDPALRAGPVTVLGGTELLGDACLARELAAHLCPREPWERTGDPGHDYAAI